MADNDKNLIPMNQRTKEEQREIARKGGIASGEARREKRDLKRALEMLLEKEYKDKKGNSKSGAELLVFKQFEKALAGDTRAFEVVRDTAGQKPVEKVEQVNIDAEYSQSVEYVRRLMEDNDE